MEEEGSGDGLRVYLVALASSGELPPVVFRLTSPFDKNEDQFVADPLTEYLHKESGHTQLIMKFMSKTGVSETCQLDLDANDADEEANLHLTIDPTKSTATLTGYECGKGEKIWKSVNLYTLALVPTSDSSTISTISVFGETEMKYKGHLSSNLFPLHANLANAFNATQEILGEGTYGVVRRCVHNGVAFAVKRIFGKPSGAPPSEVEAMVKLAGANNIVVMYSASGHQHEKNYIVYVAMEIYQRSLEDYLAAQVAVDLSKSKELFTEIMTGVKAMHSFGVIHRDLKPMNILLDTEGHVAIADFGTCVIKPSPDAAITYCGNKDLGTQYYSDPLMANCRHAEEVDIYSCGIIYAEMHLTDVSKRRKLVRDIDQKIKYRMMNKRYDFLKSSIWKGWSGDTEIVRQTLLVKASPSVILTKLGGSSSDHTESSGLE